MVVVVVRGGAAAAAVAVRMSRWRCANHILVDRCQWNSGPISSAYGGSAERASISNRSNGPSAGRPARPVRHTAKPSNVMCTMRAANPCQGQVGRRRESTSPPYGSPCSSQLRSNAHKPIARLIMTAHCTRQRCISMFLCSDASNGRASLPIRPVIIGVHHCPLSVCYDSQEGVCAH